jgi:hypothetical protein
MIHAHDRQILRRLARQVAMILKDTHTCEHRPERFDHWTQIARQEVNRALA